jgi:hypothetical protein
MELGRGIYLVKDKKKGKVVPELNYSSITQ